MNEYKINRKDNFGILRKYRERRNRVLTHWYLAMFAMAASVMVELSCLFVFTLMAVCLFVYEVVSVGGVLHKVVGQVCDHNHHQNSSTRHHHQFLLLQHKNKPT